MPDTGFMVTCISVDMELAWKLYKDVDLHPPLRIIRGPGGPYPTKMIDKTVDDNSIP